MIRRNSLAYILVYGELVFLGILLLILPRFLGTDGVWYSVPASQFLLFVLAVFFILREKSQHKQENAHKENQHAQQFLRRSLTFAYFGSLIQRSTTP